MYTISNVRNKFVVAVLSMIIVICTVMTSANSIASNAATGSSVTTSNVTATLSAVNGWQSNNQYYTQYDVSITNNGSSTINSWSVSLSGASGASVSQSWNCGISESNDTIVVTPVNWNAQVSAGSTVNSIGIIVASSSANALTASGLTVVNEDGSSNSDSSATETATDESNDSATDTSNDSATDTDTTEEDASDDSSAEATDNTSDSSSESASDTSNNDATSENTGSTSTSDATGALHVSGTNLVDANGNVVQLKGASTHGLSWFPEYVNKAGFQTLRDDWGANVIRLALYTEDYNGYLTGGNQTELKNLIDNGVNYATELGMYVIIDWHILSDGNPTTHQSEAIEFFSEMSEKYAGYDNVLYEICNEPQGSDWNSVIKPYAEKVISAIRENDSDAVVIVGTNTWSQDVDAVIGNEIDDPNVMYTLHFYAATHGDSLRQKMVSALEAGVPVFVTECSICESSGNGNIDYDSASAWLNLMNQYNVSYVAWNLSNKSEAAALISSSSSSLSGWSTDELTATGKWFRQAMRGEIQ